MVNTNQLNSTMGVYGYDEKERADQEAHEISKYVRDMIQAKTLGIPREPPPFIIRSAATDLGMNAEREKSQAALQRKIDREADHEYQKRMSAQVILTERISG
jgi:hypothetical protein